MRKRKFVVIKDDKGNIQIRFGIVELHYELFDENKYKCLGGGLFDTDCCEEQIHLHGKSIDYGYVDWNKINPGEIHAEEDFNGFQVLWGDPSEDGFIETNITEKFKFDL